MNADLIPNSIVEVGQTRFGNRLPLSLIAGPCALESRAHALEMAQALKEIAARLKIGLVYKTSFDKANRTSVKQRARHGPRPGAADLRRHPRQLGLAGADRRSRDRAVRPRRASCRRAADPGVPLPPDRPADRRGEDRQDGQRQEGPVPGAVGHEERGGENHRRRKPQRAGDRARRLVRLQHARLRHAGAADPGPRHRRAGDLRRDAFGAAAGRAGHNVGGEREFVPVLARAAVAVGVAGVFIETHQDPDAPRPTVRTWCRSTIWKRCCAG